jgi:ribosomal protein S18 acetylase RimI-like enzyme
MAMHDRRVVYRDLLPVIAESYPRAEQWLERRLDDVLDGRAECLIARDSHGLRAVVIQTPKGTAQLKLSTIWVAERARGRGIGARLITRCRKVWLRREIAEVWVTASPSSIDAVAGLLAPRGFAVAARTAGRYSAGEVETVLRWTPALDVPSSFFPRFSVGRQAFDAGYVWPRLERRKPAQAAFGASSLGMSSLPSFASIHARALSPVDR